MKKIKEAKKLDWEARHQELQRGYGVEHPERIHGYEGLFFTLGDVYASDAVVKFMEWSEDFRAFVFQSLGRFAHDDYGDISENDHDENVEMKWLSCGWPLFGRYGYKTVRGNGKEVLLTVIKIRRLKNVTTVMGESEMDEVPRCESILGTFLPYKSV